MKTESEKLDRVFLWLLLTGGLISLLIYGLASFIAEPSAETITTHAPAPKNDAQEIKYPSSK